MARTSKWLTHTHTDTHTDAGDDNTRRPKLASGKNTTLDFYLGVSGKTLALVSYFQLFVPLAILQGLTHQFRTHLRSCFKPMSGYEKLRVKYCRLCKACASGHVVNGLSSYCSRQVVTFCETYLSRSISKTSVDLTYKAYHNSQIVPIWNMWVRFLETKILWLDQQWHVLKLFH